MGEYTGMTNLRMQEKLNGGECLDVDVIGTPIANWPGHWVLQSFTEDIDYCVAQNEAWIWSIGKHRQTSQIVASVYSDLYQHPDFECLWLR